MAKVAMGPSEWRAAASEARWLAVQYAQPGGHGWDSQTRLQWAADMLQAADVFEGRANMLELGGEVDEAEVEEPF